MEKSWGNGEFTFDLSTHVLFKKDEHNYIYAVGAEQLKTIGHMSLLDIFLMSDNSIEFHYHPNASELVYCATGKIEVGLLNPGDNEWRHFHLKAGDVISLPQGSWHYFVALKDNTHLVATFDTDNLQTMWGSDVLRITPKALMAETYCLDVEELHDALDPIDETVIIGPPVDCYKHTDSVGNQMGMNQSQKMIRPGVNEAQEIDQPNMGENFLGMVALEQSTLMDRGEDRESDRKERNQPVRYGGTVVREMNVCESCMREFNS